MFEEVVERWPFSSDHLRSSQEGIAFLITKQNTPGKREWLMQNKSEKDNLYLMFCQTDSVLSNISKTAKVIFGNPPARPSRNCYSLLFYQFTIVVWKLYL